MLKLLAVFLSLACWKLPAQTQASGGDLAGIVTDAQERGVSGATIIAEAPERGISRRAVTSLEGQYRILLLPPGEYRVRFTATGFTAHVVEGAQIRVGQ